jgi:hypothetical protein
MANYDLLVLTHNEQEMMITHQFADMVIPIIGSKTSCDMDYLTATIKAMTELHNARETPMKGVSVKAFRNVPIVLSGNVASKWFDASLNMSGSFNQLAKMLSDTYDPEHLMPRKPGKPADIADSSLLNYGSITDNFGELNTYDGFNEYTDTTAAYTSFDIDMSYVIVHYVRQHAYEFIEGNKLSPLTLKLLNNDDFKRVCFPGIEIRIMTLNTSKFVRGAVMDMVPAFNNINQVIQYLHNSYSPNGINRLYYIVENMIDFPIRKPEPVCPDVSGASVDDAATAAATDDETWYSVNELYNLFICRANVKSTDELRTQFVFLLNTFNVPHKVIKGVRYYSNIKKYVLNQSLANMSVSHLFQDNVNRLNPMDPMTSLKILPQSTTDTLFNSIIGDM